MSLFGDLDVESAEDNPWLKPDGPYKCALAGVSVKATKAGDKMGMTLEFKIVEGSKKGRKITPWNWIPTKNQLAGYKSLQSKDNEEKDEEFAERAATAVSQLKKNMMDMGIPADRINSMDAQNLMDMEQLYIVTIRNKNGSENVTSIAVDEDTAGGSPNPFAG